MHKSSKPSWGLNGTIMISEYMNKGVNFRILSKLVRAGLGGIIVIYHIVL